MGVTYSGLQLGDELLDGVLESYGVERNIKHDYIMKDTPSGIKIVEYDDDGEIINSYSSTREEVVDMSYFDEVKKDILKTKESNNRLKIIRYYIIGSIAMLVLLAFIVIIIGKGVI